MTEPAISVEGGLYRLLVESVRDYAIFALDTTGRVLSWNAGAQAIKGYTAEEIIGRHFSTFYPEVDIAAGKPAMELVVAAREGRFEEEGWRLRQDGSRFWANVVITALRNPEGELFGFTKVTRDLTERRAAHERALEDARRISSADAGNHAKTAFLAAMSHELRTPLNAIGGYAELIEVGVAGPITEQQRTYLGRIRASQQHLLGIISDLLNYGRIESGQVRYDLAEVPLETVLDAVLPLLEPQAGARKVTLERAPRRDDVVACADRAKVEQVVLNLLSNAVKFTEAGGRVTASCLDVAGRATIVVHDTGIGIAVDEQSAIFEPFVQLGRTLSSAHEGTGLGLAISRDLARAMHGDVTVESVPAEGSTFRLLLPSA
jgi:PAS domain S-box-containing protein